MEPSEEMYHACNQRPRGEEKENGAGALFEEN